MGHCALAYIAILVSATVSVAGCLGTAEELAATRMEKSIPAITDNPLDG